MVEVYPETEALQYAWQRICAGVSFAFQPIVGANSGMVVAQEALMRGWEAGGFSSIHHLLDRSVIEGMATEVNEMLLMHAISEFLTCGFPDSVRLNFNLDNRMFADPSAAERLLATIRSTNLPPERVVLELSEQEILPAEAHAESQLPLLRRSGVLVAIDDFGSGYSGLQMLYEAQADIIKIDRFFIDGIAEDATKRIVVSNLIGIAHATGLHVVAEGVEHPADFIACREIGCATVQGFLVARPAFRSTAPPAAARAASPTTECRHIIELIAGDRRRNNDAAAVMRDRLRAIEPITADSTMAEVLKRFRTESELAYLPVVDSYGEPLGLLREQDLKQYVYSPYGISLLMNRAYGSEVLGHLRRVPTVPVDSRIDRVLELAAHAGGIETLVMTENGRYVGCLDSHALLQILHERELRSARDQNPLTRLPGNTVISEKLAAALTAGSTWTAVIYFDFDAFKPFNDHYGFRTGDRVIQLFSDILRQMVDPAVDFVGHVGGDDFLLLCQREADQLDAALTLVERIVARFTEDVRAYYRPEDLATGGFRALDRDGRMRLFPRLSVSAGVVLVPPRRQSLSMSTIGSAVSLIKHHAKRSPGSATLASLLPSRLLDPPERD